MTRFVCHDAAFDSGELQPIKVEDDRLPSSEFILRGKCNSTVQ